MPIKLAENFRAVFYAPFYAAQSLGFYAEEDVEVELIGSSVPGDGASALLNDTVDLTFRRRDAPPRLMSAVGSDSPLQLIFPAIDLVAVGDVRWFT
jgi:NitT/TauT family transport system substrate-binding protein